MEANAGNTNATRATGEEGAIGLSEGGQLSPEVEEQQAAEEREEAAIGTSAIQ
jgi:hypothetical protein